MQSWLEIRFPDLVTISFIFLSRANPADNYHRANSTSIEFRIGNDEVYGDEGVSLEQHNEVRTFISI